MTSSSASTGATSAVTSSYQYDVDGNRTYEGYVASGTYTDWYLNIVIPYSITHQNATVAWDAMNRMTSFTDTGTAAPATITWKYDKAGNVRNVNAVHRTLDAQGVVSTTTVTDDYWYLYDAMNRFTTTKGQLSGGVISRGLSGMDIGYDAAGQRTSMAKTMMTSVYDSFVNFTTYTWWEQKELYTYTADGYLAQTNVAAGAASYTINDPTPPAVAAATGSGTQLATMVRDAMGRVTTYTEYQPNGTTVAYSRAATYNNKSEASSDTVTVLRGSDTWVYNTTYYYDHLGNGSGTYQGGVVTKQVVTITKNGVAQTGNNTTTTYVWWDGALQNVSTYVSGATTNTSTFYYNDSGYLQSVYIQDGRPRTVSFISDGNNLILQRDEADNQSTGDPRELYYYFNGMRVGDIGNNGTSDTDYVGSVSAHTVAAGTGPFRYGSAFSTQFADFDQSYDPINGIPVTVR